MAKNNNLKDFLADVADAIREKEGSSELINPQDFSGKIRALETGGAAAAYVPAKDVNFRDYDGTILYSYTKEEFLALTELPPLPKQNGLVCEGWNWTFANAITYVEDFGFLEVGANYMTDDESTRLYIRIAAPGRQDVPINFRQTVSQGVLIDWGDGTTESLAATGNISATHHYDSIGEFIISLKINSGTLTLGHASQAKNVIGGGASSDVSIYRSMLWKAEVGKATVARYAFYKCESLRKISLSENTSLGNKEEFSYCSSLQYAALPRTLSQLNDGMFDNCTTLSAISIPYNKPNIHLNAFRSCKRLKLLPFTGYYGTMYDYALQNCEDLVAIYFPKTATINSSALSGCKNVVLYDFSRVQSIPSLYSTSSIDVSQKPRIIVPAALYNSWVAATNWSSLKDYIEPDYTPLEVIDLQVSAEDVVGNKTTTKIHWTAISNGVNGKGQPLTGITISGTSISSEFPKNTSLTDSVQREVSFTYADTTVSVTFTQGPFIERYIKCKYNVTSTSATTLIYTSTAAILNQFSHMVVDGEQKPFARTFTFASTGEHEVQFWLSDDVPLTNMYQLFYNLTTLLEADLSRLDMSEVSSTSSSSGTAYMFYGCTNLHTIALPDSVVYLGYYMFYNCKLVQSLTIPCAVAPAVYGTNTFGTGSSTMGYTNRSAGTNKLLVPEGATGYDVSNWTSYLLNKSYGGFTLEYI